MIHLQRIQTINATPDAVWAVLGRFMQMDEFAPLVKSVDALTDGEDRVGSKRRAHFTNGSSMVEEVIKWEPNRGYRVRSSELEPMPVHEMQSDLSVSPRNNGQSKVTWSTEYRMKYGPFGWLMGQTVMKRMMGKVVDGNLKGLADKVRSNQTGTEQTS